LQAFARESQTDADAVHEGLVAVPALRACS